MSTKQETAQLMFELFKGRRSAFARKVMKLDGGKIFLPARDGEEQDIPLTPKVMENHLEGTVSVGVYVIDKDVVQFAVLDFDGKRGDVFNDALTAKNTLQRELGLVSWMERSQSGKGMHLWMFFDEPIKAATVRRVLGPHIPEFNIPGEERKTSFDRMFPVQDEVVDGYGSLVALPLNGSKLIKEGKTVFVDSTNNPLKQQSAVLESIFDNLNTAESVRDVAKTMPKQEVPKNLMRRRKRLYGGMKLLSPYGCQWLRGMLEKDVVDDMSESQWHAALGQFAKFENGEVLAHYFSSKSAKYEQSQTQRKFEQAVKTNIAMKCDTIHAEFGQCEKCTCQDLGLKYPFELARIPLEKLEQTQSGKVYSGRDLADIALKAAREVDDGQRIGFAWGYDVLDDATELRPKELIIVAARRSMGKTGVIIDASLRGAMRGEPQYVFSLEMSNEALALRYLARMSEVDLTRITTGKLQTEDWQKVNSAAEQLRNLPIYLDDTTRMVEQMLDRVGELVFLHGQGPMWIDYLQLVRKQGRESQKEAVDSVIYAYKNIANIVDIPVVSLAQFNRTEEQYEGSGDLDSWLKDTGNIEQHADVIHYIRGRQAIGKCTRRWRIHKERNRAGSINFDFELDQCIFKWTPRGLWTDKSEEDTLYEDEANGFDGI
jgi:hypothetical protein